MTNYRKQLCPLWLSLFIGLGLVIGLLVTSLQRSDPEELRSQQPQVNQRVSQAHHSLQYWLTFAQISNDIEAWQQVLVLAPPLDHDDAYLAAWQYVHASADLEDAQTALLEAYRAIGHFESALSLTEKLKITHNDRSDQALLLVDTIVVEP